MKSCRICWKEEEEMKYLPLYIDGSEGIYLCHSCEMELINYIKQLLRLVSVSQKTGYSITKRILEKANSKTKG